MAPGAKLIRRFIAFEEELRWRLKRPISVRLFPEADRWNVGCGGLPGASDMRVEDCDRA